MSHHLTYKILYDHLVEGELVSGSPIAIRINQTLTQDATGTMTFLQFEAMGIDKVQTEISVSYIDHNTLQSGFENADDHLYLQSAAAKFGVLFSRPGNGVCHQVHLERFGIPGKTLLGSDSHTPTGGGIGMLAIGAGGLDVALAMAGQPFHLITPKVLNIELSGQLQPFVSAKDVILELLKVFSVKGGVGKIIEYSGQGLKNLSVPERATITNMGAELGATTSIFPSDEITLLFLDSQGRKKEWVPLSADHEAEYDEYYKVDLSSIEPLIARPHSPDAVVKVRELRGTKVQQVALGSCTNSSYRDLAIVANMLKGRKIHPDVSVSLGPGSRQVLLNLIRDGYLEPIVSAGVRITENVCGSCIGMGFAPPTDAVTVRTFNRNFLGRSGTKSAKVFLSSPETAIAAALTGEITDPRDLKIKPFVFKMPKQFFLDDSMILRPPRDRQKVEIVRGPNIKPLPVSTPLPAVLSGTVLLKVGDHITTDHIMPAGAKILPLRSNVPAIAEHVFEAVDLTFVQRAKTLGGGFIVGGVNYGQGSSREHAALAPMYLGIKAVIVKSFARIHLANLINFGILPLTFSDEKDYDRIQQGDQIQIDMARLDSNDLILKSNNQKLNIPVKHSLSSREVEVIKAGGALSFAKKYLVEELEPHR